MSVTARLGQAFAIAWLLLLYIPVGVLVHGHLSVVQVVPSLLALGAIAGLYVWFWLIGFRRSGERSAWAIIVALTIAGLVLNVASGAPTANPFIYPVVVAGFGLRPRLATAAILALTVLAMATTFVAALGQLPLAELLLAEAIGGFQIALFGFAALGFARLLATIAELRAARETIARLAVQEERARFARDLHDLLGHSLSLITLKGELAGQLLPKSPDRAATEVHELVAVARKALREVREAVSGYRQPTLASEIAGARAALSAAGIACSVEEAALALTQETEAVFAWAVREGTTNVIRHSQAGRCTITLHREGDSVLIDIVDDGPPGPPPQAGNGLRGLGERVAGCGGRLEAERLPDRGFRLRVAIPIEPPQPAPTPEAKSAAKTPT